MKAKIVKLLRKLGVDVLLLGLVEKIALGLIKKLTAWACSARSYLDRVEKKCDGIATENGDISTIA